MSNYQSFTGKLLMFFILVNFIFSGEHAGLPGSFLRMGTTARSISMGSGFTAELDQGFTAYHNPAGVSFLENKQLSLAHHVLPLDRRFLVTSFATKLPPTAGLGIAWVSAGVNQIDGRTSSGEHTNYLSTSEDALFISFGQRIQPWLSVGINVKVFYQQLPMNDNDLAGKGTGFDIGIMARPSPNIMIGLVIQDLNSNYQWNTGEVYSEQGRVYKENFPTAYRIGTNFRYDNLYFVGDVGVITDHETVVGIPVRLGTEYQYLEKYFIRAGYGNSRISLGAGMKYLFLKKKYSFLDYAFTMDVSSGLTHVFTFAFNF